MREMCRARLFCRPLSSFHLRMEKFPLRFNKREQLERGNPSEDVKTELER